MKRILIICLLGLMSCSIMAKQPQKGYRGFIYWNNDIYSYKTAIGGFKDYYTGVSTSHGYQINPWIFAGAGIDIEYFKTGQNYILAPYADIRTDLKFGKFTPFVDVRIGYNYTDFQGDISSDKGGIYFSPAIGYRINWGKRIGINLAVGFTVTGYHNEPDFGFYPPFEFKGYLSGTKTYFSFRVGFDF